MDWVDIWIFGLLLCTARIFSGTARVTDVGAGVLMGAGVETVISSSGIEIY